MTDVVRDLARQWRAEADALRRRGAAALADCLITCADDLDAALAMAHATTVTRQEASRLSGYEPDSLTRLVQEGKLANVGTPHAPRYRAADLPKRPLHSHTSRRGTQANRREA